ncbi:DNA-packaging protein [Candidatus Pacearchaeota archaeon]|nr:DNA-packaging protein [Candidatus Pacearchaeota archaeon]
MGAPKGNRFWEMRSTHGRNPIFKDPEQLWTACLEYFEWVEENPLQEEKAFSFQGSVHYAKIDKMRAMTIGGLCIFLDICDKTWHNYRNDKDFLQVVAKVEKIIRDQKFTGASADLLNANIIARDLGLKDMSSVEHSGGVSFADGLKKIGETVKSNPELEKKLEDELSD